MSDLSYCDSTDVLAPQADELGNETVLVVDDDEAVRRVVCAGLRMRGYRVIEAQDGESALAVAEAYCGPIHIVVSDVVMPVMDGHALFENLRRWYPRIAFLFISGYIRDGITNEQLATPRTAFLPKPFNASTLAREIGRVLSRAWVDV